MEDDEQGQGGIELVKPGELARRLPADRNPHDVYLGGLAAGSQPAMRDALKKISGVLAPGVEPRDVPWQFVRYQHVARIKSLLQQTKSTTGEVYGPATINRMLSALRGVLREAWLLGLMPADDYQRAKAVKLVRGETELSGRAVKAQELARLFAACDDTAAGNRDATLIALMYGCGLRRAEVASLNLGDYDRGENAVKVRGKGNKQRTVYLPVGARNAVDAWLAIRGRAPGPLICPVDKVGAVNVRRLRPEAVWWALDRRRRAAGLAKLTPHDLRRSYAGDQLDGGTDLVTLSSLMGHSDPKTTARYDRRGARAKAEAADKLVVPFQR